MYSLYRAWLSLGPCASISGSLPTLQSNVLSAPSLNLTPSTQLNTAPDVTLQVGPNLTQFSAHKNVLSAHSGFFKAALSNNSGKNPQVYNRDLLLCNRFTFI